ncbi:MULTISPECIES: SCO family protein [unclassified Streptomyces]|uniref:SCO family protein n=1 Tax=unclassified Streptomyces TaxID=2593676 RepID=UPI000DC76D81|nr:MULTISPECIES: SCO family protein [unclassified Streptomyces]AWZ05817.1 SCO family protein [Streptomyces sp. ICC4]AWZ13514.1 SCO family protein [Streptomyces sp. ICC1]
MNGHLVTPATNRIRTACAATLALAAALTLTACGSSQPHHPGTADQVVSRPAGSSPYKGTELSKPFAKPALVLTGADGQPFDLRERTAGRTVLLFFGYSSCPDVCPTTMGDVAVALGKQPQEIRDNTQVVFVTTDPERDTPAALDKWLDAFSPSFIGLSGNLEQVKKAAIGVGIAIEDPKKHHDGSVTSDHGAQVLAFTPDGEGRVVYTSGTTVDDFTHDLPLLAKNTRS